MKTFVSALVAVAIAAVAFRVWHAARAERTQIVHLEHLLEEAQLKLELAQEAERRTSKITSEAAHNMRSQREQVRAEFERYKSTVAFDLDSLKEERVQLKATLQAQLEEMERLRQSVRNNCSEWIVAAEAKADEATQHVRRAEEGKRRAEAALLLVDKLVGELRANLTGLAGCIRKWEVGHNATVHHVPDLSASALPVSTLVPWTPERGPFVWVGCVGRNAVRVLLHRDTPVLAVEWDALHLQSLRVVAQCIDDWKPRLTQITALVPDEPLEAVVRSWSEFQGKLWAVRIGCASATRGFKEVWPLLSNTTIQPALVQVDGMLGDALEARLLEFGYVRHSCGGMVTGQPTDCVYVTRGATDAPTDAPADAPADAPSTQ